MASKKKLNTRWRKGNTERYTGTDREFLKRFSEEPGWRNGAKVYRKGGK